ncbi:unnamed protein product, partial [Brassica oleracea]
CWRKLERHNNIRKRKPVDKGGVASKQQQVNMIGQALKIWPAGRPA